MEEVAIQRQNHIRFIESRRETHVGPNASAARFLLSKGTERIVERESDVWELSGQFQL